MLGARGTHSARTQGNSSTKKKENPGFRAELLYRILYRSVTLLSLDFENVAKETKANKKNTQKQNE